MREHSEMILGDLVRIRAEERPDLDVLTFEHSSLDACATPDEVRTYAELATRGNRIAAALISKGLEHGERFGLMMRNHPEFVETMVGASLAGCVIVPVDPRTKGEKLAFLLANSGCRGIVCADYCLAELDAVRDRIPNLDWVIALETGEGADAVPISSIRYAESLREVLAEPAASVDVRVEDPDDPLQIIYTSGTTGDPKGVVFPNARFGAFGLLGALLGYRADDRPYTGLSLTHGNAQAVTLAPSLSMGLRAVFSRRFTKSRVWDVCRQYGCTTFSLLGGMTTTIYSQPPRPDDGENPVRFVVSAGMPAAIWEPFEKRFGLRVFEWYGAVEGGVAFNPIGKGPIGSFGKPMPGLEMKIVDEAGDECAAGAIGEIVSRPASGAPASVEYFENPEASRQKTRGGWLRSGDMGHRDAEGWFYFDYRKGGGIRRSGDFINPSFIEKVIAESPAVTEVFVYGVPAASMAPGESDIVAAVVAKDADEFSPEQTFAACRAGLESNFVPSYLQVVDEIPKTVSEKPQERLLLDAFAPDAKNVFTECKPSAEVGHSGARI